MPKPDGVHLADRNSHSAPENRAGLPLAPTFVSPRVCRMIYRCLLALLCLFSAGNALAQMRVELEFDQETYLPREPLYATVLIYNNSGRTLELGDDNTWLSFTVENVDGSIVKQKKPADVKGKFTLPSSKYARKLVNLAEAYDLSKFGRYVVRAVVDMPEWQANYASKPIPVGIATGVKLWETTFGLPTEEQAGRRPEMRKYQLLSANHLKQLSLYVRVTGESEAETFTLFPLGPLHGFSQPEPQVDRWSNLHVLYQDNARTFRYNMITPDGMLLTREIWEIANDSRPALKINSEGRIIVSGGIRRITINDLPPPDLSTDTSDPAPAPAPPVEKKPDAKPTKK